MFVQVSLEIPDELAAQAKAQGIPVERYVQDLLQRAVPRAAPPERKRTVEEFHAWLEEFAQFSDKIPVLSDEAISREAIYENRD